MSNELRYYINKPAYGMLAEGWVAFSTPLILGRETRKLGLITQWGLSKENERKKHDKRPAPSPSESESDMEGPVVA